MLRFNLMINLSANMGFKIPNLSSLFEFKKVEKNENFIFISSLKNCISKLKSFNSLKNKNSTSDRKVPDVKEKPINKKTGEMAATLSLQNSQTNQKNAKELLNKNKKDDKAGRKVEKTKETPSVNDVKINRSIKPLAKTGKRNTKDEEFNLIVSFLVLEFCGDFLFIFYFNLTINVYRKPSIYTFGNKVQRFQNVGSTGFEFHRTELLTNWCNVRITPN
ncbi:hypothetical protein BpHYR1_050288 [Brachionus plicatilis]|uniref:Uncharacterized protein n=1 Tax=Brachionus plicatilis TaxID=10195 RepID=A0A3M7SWG9_BRAPC|nr:hypothetical protein BpHYR1_050288 [Brachionus plicatilis]